MLRFMILAGLGVLLLLAGCESSNNPTSLTPGDNSDENFQFVSEEVVDGYSYQGVEIGIDLSTSLVDSIPGSTAMRRLRQARPAYEDGEVVIESYSYSLQGTWHVFQVSGYVAKYSPVDTFNLEAIDSIQLVSNETPIVYPDSTMDGFDYRFQFDLWSRTNADSLAGHHEVEMRLQEDFTGLLNADLAENIRFQHSDSAKTCDVAVANSFQASDVVIDLVGGGCPLGGSILLTSAISIDCQGTGGGFSTSVDGVWSIHGTYNGTTESYTVSNGSTVWTHSQPCGGPAAISLNW